MTKESITEWFLDLQNRICKELELTDSKGLFKEDSWEREGGGGGKTRILENGELIERGGVNFSAVHGPTPKNILEALDLPPSDFYATGVSIVMHPVNPMVPIIHMNVRYFEMSDGTAWFGGGIDLTPHYIDKKDATYFHSQLKKVCDRHHFSYYPEFKAWADNYFFLPHRNETRGIGGIFFDKLSSNEEFSLKQRFAFVQDVGNSFAPIYTYFLNKNSKTDYGENEKKWQMLRRGRYVEFNLVWDKGTKFGLDTSGRTESILMSLPPQANWQYNYQPKKDSPEEETLQQLKKGIDWIK